MSQANFYFPNKDNECPVQIITKLLNINSSSNNSEMLNKVVSHGDKGEFIFSVFGHPNTDEDNLDSMDTSINEVLEDHEASKCLPKICNFLYAHVCRGFQVFQSEKWESRINNFISYDGDIHISDNLTPFALKFYKDFFEGLMELIADSSFEDIDRNMIDYHMDQVKWLKRTLEGKQEIKDTIGFHIVNSSFNLRKHTK